MRHMICPHCKKAIKLGVTPEIRMRAKKLHAEGYSFREMERILFSEGLMVSHVTLFRMLKGTK